MLTMNADQIQRFLETEFPQALRLGCRIERIDEGALWARLPVAEVHMRPGGTVSGPTMMTLADTAMFLLILASLGPVALAVTTHLSIDFLRRPAPRDLLAHAELLKLGSRLVVGRVTLRSEGTAEPVAHATLTYALPSDAHAPADT